MENYVLLYLGFYCCVGYDNIVLAKLIAEIWERSNTAINRSNTTRCNRAALVCAVACASPESPPCFLSTLFAASCLVLERAHLLVVGNVQVLELHYTA